MKSHQLYSILKSKSQNSILIRMIFSYFISYSFFPFLYDTLLSGWPLTSCYTTVPGRTWSMSSSSSTTINTFALIFSLIRIQFAPSSYSHQVTDHRHQLDSKLASLLRMVVEDTTRTKQGLDSLYRRLVTLLVLRLVLSAIKICKSNPNYELEGQGLATPRTPPSLLKPTHRWQPSSR